ncbi:MAG: hypothetical protein GXO57_07710, partial [Thermodesulfobacteria bacterium]|nr:hypothetical protein [Thermodesulfobacteriota bacterium]
GGGLILYFISFLFAIGINKTVFKGWKKKKAKVKDLSLSEQEFKLIILHTLLSYSNWENYGKKWKKLKDKYAKVINKLEEEFLSNNVDIEELRKNYLQAIEDLKKDKIGETLYEADLFFMEVYKEIVKKLG